jgi:undecaprenyl-diphosphatase
METLQQLDIAILRWIHHGWRCGVLDAFFTTITNGRLFIIPLLIAWLVLLWRGGRTGRQLALVLAATLLFTDQVSSHLLKPWIGRVRPCFEVPGVTALIAQSHSASFPSSHAANSFGAATVLSLQCRRWAPVALAIALLAALSRVYLGVHYPSDMLAGAALGCGIGASLWALARRAGWLRRTGPCGGAGVERVRAQC